jgi:hypothetical protein
MGLSLPGGCQIYTDHASCPQMVFLLQSNVKSANPILR